MIVINLFGSPGVGKSTFAAFLFQHMKKKDYSVEYVSEFAKDMVYEHSSKAFACQPYIFGQQLFRLTRLQDEVDFAICDSPILLSNIYNPEPSYAKSFLEFSIDVHNNLKNINFLLSPPEVDKYDESGRLHSAQESLKIHDRIKDMLVNSNIPFLQIRHRFISSNDLVDIIENEQSKLRP